MALRLQKASLLFVICAPLIARSESAFAHAPAAVAQFVSRDPSDVILATNRGLVLGALDTRKWSLLCNEALGVRGVGTSSSYHLVVLPSGRWLLASVDGMSFSDDRGCNWQELSALSDFSTPALVQHPNDPLQLYVATYAKGETGIRVSRDGGESFQILLPVPDGQYTSSLLVAPTDPVTIYLATVGLGDDKKLQFQVFGSSDGGSTWRHAVVPHMDGENELYLLAVNPAQPNELFARAAADEPGLGERLLWSQDGGQTFTSPLTLNTLQTAAFSPDGSVAYAGGVDGLWRADDATRAFMQVPMTARIACVEQSEDELLAAGYYNGLDAMRDGVGIWMGSAFERWMDLDEVSDQADCPAPSTASDKCAQLWQDWQLENPNPAWSDADAGASSIGSAGDAGDAGGSDATRDSADSSTGDRGSKAKAPSDNAGSAARSEGGCDVRGHPHSCGHALIALALALWWRARRRCEPSARHSA